MRELNMASYDLVIRVADEDKLATIISALAGAGTVLSLSLAKKQGRRLRPELVIGSRYVGGLRTKPIKGDDLIKRLFTEKAVQTTPELTKAFVSNGFAKNSMSPRLSYYLKSKKVKSIGPGKYQWVG